MLVEHDEVEPVEAVAEVFGGDAPVASEQVLEALGSAVDGMNVKVVADALALSMVDRMMSQTEQAGAGTRSLSDCADSSQRGFLCRGVQYLAMNYTQRLAEAKLVPSVGSVGDS